MQEKATTRRHMARNLEAIKEWNQCRERLEAARVTHGISVEGGGIPVEPNDKSYIGSEVDPSPQTTRVRGATPATALSKNGSVATPAEVLLTMSADDGLSRLRRFRRPPGLERGAANVVGGIRI